MPCAPSEGAGRGGRGRRRGVYFNDARDTDMGLPSGWRSVTVPCPPWSRHWSHSRLASSPVRAVRGPLGGGVPPPPTRAARARATTARVMGLVLVVVVRLRNQSP